jgi:hypothetical protein
LFLGALIGCIAVAALVLIADTYVFTPMLRRSEGWFEAAEYPQLAAQSGWKKYGLPAALPSGSSRVAIFAPASAPSFLPAPDQYVEVRFFLPLPQAAALLATEQAGAAAIPAQVSSAYGPPNFVVPVSGDDAQDGTPPSFTHLILRNPGGMNIGALSVDTTTGQVIYWIREQ